MRWLRQNLKFSPVCGYIFNNYQKQRATRHVLESGVPKPTNKLTARALTCTSKPRSLSHSLTAMRVLSPGVCWLRASCLSGVCSTGGTDCVVVHTPSSVLNYLWGSLSRSTNSGYAWLSLPVERTKMLGFCKESTMLSKSTAPPPGFLSGCLMPFLPTHD